MTIHRISAGDGYEYYTREVASDDERRQHRQELGDYYLQTGAPPGVWEGSEIYRHFGISGEVTEQQMRDLFGQGKRPDAEQIRQARDGVVDERRLLLGNPYGVYGSSLQKQFTDAVNEAVRDYRNDNDGAEPSRRDLARMRRRVAHDMFVADRNREPVDDAELRRFLTTQTRPSAQAVAGFDLTFSVPKSVSVMWALGDKDLQRRIEEAHTSAIRDTLGYLEADVIGSRAGRNGVRRVPVDGVLAARFRHYDSRAGDPQLHDHVVVSNKVFVPFGGSDPQTGKPRGVWRTIDSKALYKATVAASTRYDNALMTRLTRDLGVTFEQRGGGSQATKMEITSVPEPLVKQFSTRRTSIVNRLEELTQQYRTSHGREPDRRTVMRLAQQATLETRQSKQHRPLPERVQEWHERSRTRFTAAGLDAERARVQAAAGERPGWWQRLASHVRRNEAARPAVPEPVDDATLALRVLNGLEERRSTWTRRHVQAETARQVAAATGGHDCDGTRIDLITTRVMSDPGMVRLSHPEPVLHSARADANGVSVYDHPDMWRYTSTTVIDRENELLDAAERQVVPPVSRTTLDHVLTEAGDGLGADKIRAIEALTLSPRAVVTAVGPAGAGKTTAMRHVASAVAAQGGTLVGLAPSAVAARELGRSLGVDTMTAHRWLSSEGWTGIGSGDMVLVDEAGMVDNLTLAAVTSRALDAGAVVRMVGDPAQLGAVDAGGAFDLLHTATGDGVELDTVWRFRDPQEAEASLALRSGPQRDAFTWYQENNRVRAGGEQEILTEALRAWSTDHEDGRRSIIIASTTERVAELNDQISSARAAAGETTQATTQVLTRDGHVIRLGDTVLTRLNDPSNPYGRNSLVRNGDLFTVSSVGEDGSLRVIAPDHSVVDLDPHYTAENVQLGYASTVHRSQGVTVDTAHAVLDASVDRATAYVALTRGRDCNTAWVVVEDDQPTTDVLDAIASRSPDNVTVLDAAAREAQAAADPVRMRDVYADLDATANRIRWSRHLDDLVRDGHVPPAAGRATESMQFPDVVGRLTDLEAAGVAVDTLLHDLTTDIGRPEDPATEIATRIDQWSHQHPTVLDPAHHGPLSGLDDQALTGLADRAGRQAQAAAARAQARDSAQPVDVGDSEPAPAWTRRPYGDLADAELSRRIRDAVGESFARAADSPGRRPDTQADQAVSQMLAERDTRAAMDPAARRMEDAQRWEVSHLGGQPVDMREAMRHVDRSAQAAAVVAREVAEEQDRRRWRTPASRQDVGRETGVGEGLTQWAAPTAAIEDRRTPATWRDALVAQRQRLDEAVTRAGREALDTASWAQGLTRPQQASPQQWQRAVGEVATWRAANHVGDHYPLERTAESGETTHDASVHQLAQSLARHQQQDGSDGQAATRTGEVAARRRQATTEALRRARQALNEQREQARRQQQRSTTTQRPAARPPRSSPGGPRL